MEDRGLTKGHLKRDMDMASNLSPAGFHVLCPVKKKRSKLSNKVSDFSFVSKFSGEEDAAMSMLMLSSGFTNWDDFLSDFGSAETDPLISKAKALYRKEFELIFDTGVELGNKKELGSDLELLISGVCDQDTELSVKVSSCESKFGDFFQKRAIDNLGKGNNFQIKKIGFGEHGTESGIKLTCCDSEHGNFATGKGVEKPMKDDNFEINPVDSESVKIRASQESSGFVDVEIDESGSKISENCEKEVEFKCKTCNKIFPSFQSLGSHRSKKCQGNSCKMEICYERKKNKCMYECPTCSKVFPSGQALGGHKRAHFVGFTEYKISQSTAGVISFSVEEQLGSNFRLRPCGAEINRVPDSRTVLH